MQNLGIIIIVIIIIIIIIIHKLSLIDSYGTQKIHRNDCNIHLLL